MVAVAPLHLHWPRVVAPSTTGSVFSPPETQPCPMISSTSVAALAPSFLLSTGMLVRGAIMVVAVRQRCRSILQQHCKPVSNDPNIVLVQTVWKYVGSKKEASSRKTRSKTWLATEAYMHAWEQTLYYTWAIFIFWGDIPYFHKKHLLFVMETIIYFVEALLLSIENTLFCWKPFVSMKHFSGWWKPILLGRKHFSSWERIL